MNDPVPQMPFPPPKPSGTGWWGGVAVVFLLGSVVFEFQVALATVPKFERLFQDMVGVREKLPLLAQAALSSARFQAANFIPLAASVIALAGLLWWKRHTKAATGCAVVLVLLVLAWSVLTWVGVALPAAQLVHHLGTPDAAGEAGLRNHLDVPPKH